MVALKGTGHGRYWERGRNYKFSCMKFSKKVFIRKQSN